MDFPTGKQRRWRRWVWELLFPLGGTLLGLLVMPVAIAQYPEFFNRSEWLLPLSVTAVLICWGLPLLVHDNAQKVYRRIVVLPKIGVPLLAVLVVLLIAISSISSVKLLRYHRDHLRRLLAQTGPTVTRVQVTGVDLTRIQGALSEIERNTASSAHPVPQIPAPEVEELGQLNQFIAEHGELELEKQFGFDVMLARNIQMVRDRIVAFRKTGDMYNFDVTPYRFDGGEYLLELKGLPAWRTGPGGGVVGPLPANRVFLIMLPKEYVDGRAKLSEFERSSELPTSITATVKEFDLTVGQDAKILRGVLDKALQENPDNFLLHDDAGSYYWLRIDALYRQSRIPLSPKADAVRSAIREFLGLR